jgi:hypothetical protein
MGKVKSTQVAVDTLNQMQGTIAKLREELTTLGSTGDRLSQPDVWRGPLANDFHNVWGTAKKANDQLIVDLDKLRNDVRAVVEAIRQAGGHG